MCMFVLPPCMYIFYILHVPEENFGYTRTGVRGLKTEIRSSARSTNAFNY